jgi:thiol-disulfide isomerase/thioredoxin
VIPSPVHAQVRWEKSLAAAKQAAARDGKPLLVDFYATWCGPCKMMEEQTFRDPTVRALMQRAVCVRLDLDTEPPLAKQYEVQSIPRVMLFPAAGGQPMMDLEGFRDATDFGAELRSALKLKPAEGVLPQGGSPELAQLRQALEKGQYPALKTSDPKAAANGLDRLVEALGVYKEANLPPLVALLRQAGDDAIPALLRGMAHRHLAVRAAAYRTLQTLLRERKVPASVPYDPWAPAAARQAQVQKWSGWWRGHPSR